MWMQILATLSSVGNRKPLTSRRTCTLPNSGGRAQSYVKPKSPLRNVLSGKMLSSQLHYKTRRASELSSQFGTFCCRGYSLLTLSSMNGQGAGNDPQGLPCYPIATPCGLWWALFVAAACGDIGPATTDHRSGFPFAIAGAIGC